MDRILDLILSLLWKRRAGSNDDLGDNNRARNNLGADDLKTKEEVLCKVLGAIVASDVGKIIEGK